MCVSRGGGRVKREEGELARIFGADPGSSWVTSICHAIIWATSVFTLLTAAGPKMWRAESMRQKRWVGKDNTFFSAHDVLERIFYVVDVIWTFTFSVITFLWRVVEYRIDVAWSTHSITALCYLYWFDVSHKPNRKEQRLYLRKKSVTRVIALNIVIGLYDTLTDVC